jgi:hypothetical protein
MSNENEQTPEQEVVDYPMWRVAMAAIIERYQRDGYGAQFSHNELKALMGINDGTTIEEAEKARLAYVKGICSIKKELLLNDNLCIHSVIGVGYRVLHPKEQIREGFEMYQNRAKSALRNGALVMGNVDTTQLDTGDQQLMIDRINRLAHIKQSFRRRLITQ